ncbi:unnamed protein product [Phaedon cochleariae]|uniref:PEHE domain-containing protein n=1 Tax=Phaedon cochleariae TaxID=80249 RepID=A0A9N9X224_PHACE|nr:unnamed protein product [Phaedon cochleariae]
MHSIAGKKNKGGQSYDIDNIVIPYSVAASTRVEKLQWRIAETDCNIAGYDSINNGAAKDFDQDSDTEDTSEEAVLARHDRSEYDEKKRFLSYLKMPPGGQTTRGRSHRRTDSRAESSEANTPDPMSPHPHNPNSASCAGSASAASIDQSGEVGSPPATPMAVEGEGGGATLPSVAVPPYEARTFPIDDATYSQMLDHMPENHSRCRTNARSQDARAVCPTADERLSSYGAGSEERAERAGSPDSESTESAVGDGEVEEDEEEEEEEEEEDPNDPEWMDVEQRVGKDRYKR